MLLIEQTMALLLTDINLVDIFNSKTVLEWWTQSDAYEVYMEKQDHK